MRQEGVRYGSLPIVLDGLLTHLADPDEALRKMSDMIKNEVDNNFQVHNTEDTVNQIVDEIHILLIIIMY